MLIKNRGDQNLPVDLHLSYGDLLGGTPSNVPSSSIAAVSQASASVPGDRVGPAPRRGEIRLYERRLVKQHIDDARLQCRDQKVVAVVGVGRHHISRGKGSAEATQQPQLTGALARRGADRGIEYRSGGKPRTFIKAQKCISARTVGAGLDIFSMGRLLTSGV
jgi:hypothetical protein